MTHAQIFMLTLVFLMLPGIVVFAIVFWRAEKKEDALKALQDEFSRAWQDYFMPIRWVIGLFK